MSVTLENKDRSFPMPDPRMDFVKGRSFVYWGSYDRNKPDKVRDPEIYDEMRTILINEHLNSNDPSLRTFEPLESFQITPISIFNWRFPLKDMIQRGSIWQYAGYIVGAVGFLLVGVRVNFLAFKLFKAVRFQYPDGFLYVMLLNFGIFAIIEDCVRDIFQAMLNTTFKEYVFIQKMVNKSSSMKECKLEQLANESVDGRWKDPISSEIISNEMIRSPKILGIGQYAFNIESVLQAMFTRTCCINGEIPHPIENRALSSLEQQKFIEDISAFFCIEKKEQLLKCWDVKLEVAALMEKLDLSFLTFTSGIAAEEITSMKDQIENQVKALCRICKLYELIPESIYELDCIPTYGEPTLKFTLSNLVDVTCSFGGAKVDDQVPFKIKIDSQDSVASYGLLYQE